MLRASADTILAYRSSVDRLAAEGVIGGLPRKELFDESLVMKAIVGKVEGTRGDLACEMDEAVGSFLHHTVREGMEMVSDPPLAYEGLGSITTEVIARLNMLPTYGNIPEGVWDEMAVGRLATFQRAEKIMRAAGERFGVACINRSQFPHQINRGLEPFDATGKIGLMRARAVRLRQRLPALRDLHASYKAILAERLRLAIGDQRVSLELEHALGEFKKSLKVARDQDRRALPLPEMAKSFIRRVNADTASHYMPRRSRLSEDDVLLMLYLEEMRWQTAQEVSSLSQ